MDIQTKKNMFYIFTALYIFLIGQETYKLFFTQYSISGAITFIIIGTLGYAITYAILNHDIKKFERWKKQAIEYSTSDTGVVSDLSLSSTRENGRNTVILSATYQDHELTFAGLHHDYQFKYKIGSEIDLLIHPDDPQQFVLKDLK
jgi:hypothetical protein